MEGLLVFAVLIQIVLIVGAVCGFIALAKANKLTDELQRIKTQLLAQATSLPQHTNTTQAPDLRSAPAINKNTQTNEDAPTDAPDITPPLDATSENVSAKIEKADTTSNKTTSEPVYQAQISIQDNKLVQQIKDNWLVWVGGLALAFGGIFMVNYLLEAGLLSIAMRLTLGAAFGGLLIAGAEYLHYKKVPFEGFANYVPAALAGSGFISLFALTLLALMSFELIGAQLAFVLLALIALLASWYALRFGPVLAVLGILGAYSVPLWINSEQPQWAMLLAYVALITFAATLVAKKVQRHWLWYLLWTGHFGWLALIINSQSNANELYLGIAVFLLFSLWLLIMLPRVGLRFKQLDIQPFSLRALAILQPDNQLFLVIFAMAAWFLMPFTDSNLSLNHYAIFIAILSVPLLLAPIRYSGWDSWPFFLFALLALLLFNQDMPMDYDQPLMAFTEVLGVALAFALLLFVYGLYFAHQLPQRLGFAILASAVVFVVLALSYANAKSEVRALENLYPVWCILLLVSAAVLIALAQRSKHLMQQFCYWSGSNANIAFVFTLILDKSALTLALVMQVVAMSWLIRKYRVAAPHWPIKLLVAGILARLSIAPWQSDYQNFEIFSWHWSTVIYPLVIALFAATAYLWKDQLKMQIWLKGALLHLIALFVTTQSSLLLVGHIPNFANLGLHEQIVLSMNWLLLACAYLYRQQMAHTMAWLYRLAAIVLLVGAAVLQLRLMVQDNPLFNFVFVGHSIIFSWLWLWWGVPALATFWIYKKHLLLDENVKKPALILSGLFATLLINGLIRQFWQEGSINLEKLTSSGELYSYSIVWLLIGALTVIAGHIKQHALTQRIGLILLGLVVAKVFLLDMANLQGLLRAVSFIGLGLCLVALGWLFQWLRKQENAST